MKDVNLPLRRAYYAALAGIVYNTSQVNAYYGELPNSLNPDYYIIFSSISSNDISSKSNASTSTSIQVKIFTKKDLNNSGSAADEIANIVMNRLYPNTHTHLDLTGSGLQIYNTKLITDITSEIQIDAQLKFIDRTLIFSHKIYQN